jgi:hypothetical protein
MQVDADKWDVGPRTRRDLGISGNSIIFTLAKVNGKTEETTNWDETSLAGS